MKTYYIAINDYRTSNSPGFSNTWSIYECTRSEQRYLLTVGAPVRDLVLLHQNGVRYQYKTTIGIRLATRKEIRAVHRLAKLGAPVPAWFDTSKPADLHPID